MRPLADDGDADAQYNIGWMYLNGYGLRVNESLGEVEVPKNSGKAIDYYLLAAKEGQEDTVTILQSMMMRNDQEIRGRMHSIIDQHHSLFGQPRQVKARKLKVRKNLVC